MRHISASASHYNYAADKYDAIYDKHPEIDNKLIATMLKKYNVKSVIDFSCGTGAQAIYLAQKGYCVTGIDINKKMLSIARKKVKKPDINCNLLLGDMRNTKVEPSDAVITMFNSIGHLTRADFKKALKNIAGHLQSKGLYIFDIFNHDFMSHGDNIATLTIDQLTHDSGRCLRKIQYSTISEKGVLASHTTSIVKKESGTEKTSHDLQTLQIYNLADLKAILHKAGFKHIKTTGISGDRYNKFKTKHMLVLAQKMK